jgi:hypothetical protein
LPKNNQSNDRSELITERLAVCDSNRGRRVTASRKTTRSLGNSGVINTSFGIRTGSIDKIKTELEKIYQQSDDLLFEYNIGKFLKAVWERSEYPYPVLTLLIPSLTLLLTLK